MSARILIVEDEALIADDIQRTLTALGYDAPRSAATGKEAIRAAEETRPQLALVDIKLKGSMDGIDAAREIRARFGTAIVYLTSHSDDETLARAKTTVPYGYLLKPFNDRELRTTIEIALHKHETEVRLAARERLFSTTLHSIGDAVIATDERETITFMNDVAETLTGWKRNDAIGKHLDEVRRVVDATGAPIEPPLRRAIRESRSVELPKGAALIVRSGARVAVEANGAPIVDDDGRVLGGVVVFRNVAEKQKLEQRVSRSERLASIGTLLGGMGHEINNPLAYVVANVGFAVTGLHQAIDELTAASAAGTADDALPGTIARLHDVQSGLVDAAEGAERIRALVARLKQLARAEESRTLVDLPLVLDAAVRMTANAVQNRAHVRKAYGTTPYVEANEGQLTQVFTNLIVNAAQAIAEGDPERNEITLSTYTDATGRAVATVSDTGAGIAGEALGRIFDPFFTTKPTGAGTGLGLAVCHELVAAIGGDIAVESKIGHGTTFRVALPCATHAPKSAPGPAEPTKMNPQRRGRIMVVDDEPAVARALGRMLRAQHDVTIANDAHEALAELVATNLYDVIFCDMMMPDITGPELHRALSAARPEQADRIVFMTGGSVSPGSNDYLDSIANVAIAKPFSAETVQRIVRDYIR